jgi:aspartate/methionine/tyrosine aminotransferase
MDDAKLTRILSENGVLVIPGSAFGSKGKKWIRINYGLDKEILKEGIKRISEALRK